MSERSILVIEDEPTLAETLAFNLGRQGYRVGVENDGAQALTRFEAERPDLVILDVMLPGLDGFEVCRRIRTRSSVPILMLTARDEEIDRVLGLEIGADDYLTKPFSLRELQARVRALFRRAANDSRAADAALVARDLRVSQPERRVWRAGEPLYLRPQEYDLLVYLMRNRSIALTRQQILDGAWDSNFFGDERTVDVHVRALRAALEDDPAHPTRIVTVRGVGYRFEG
jgi:DNA-binding response OmpR family regulator